MMALIGDFDLWHGNLGHFVMHSVHPRKKSSLSTCTQANAEAYKHTQSVTFTHSTNRDTTTIKSHRENAFWW